MNFALAGRERVVDCGDSTVRDAFIQMFRTPELSSCSMLDISECFRETANYPRSLNVKTYLESRLGHSSVEW